MVDCMNLLEKLPLQFYIYPIYFNLDHPIQFIWGDFI